MIFKTLTRCALAVGLATALLAAVTFTLAQRLPARAAGLSMRLMSDVIVNPGDSIQTAINTAIPGDNIVINAGVYTESLTLNKAVSLIGQNRATTVIHAVSGQRVLTVTGSTITASTVISGLTFTGGSINSGPSCTLTNCGGGIMVTNSAQPLIQNIALSNNSATAGGGLYALLNSPLTLINVDVTNNSATGPANSDGAGAYLLDNVTLIGSRFEGNVGDGSGGGLYAGRGLVLSSSLFISNSAKDGGGVTHLGTGNGRIVNTLFARNSATSKGAALYLSSSGNVQVLHMTLADPAGNSGKAIDISGGTVGLTDTIISGYDFGIRRTGGGAVYENYNLFFNNNNDISGLITSGGNSLVGNPLFVNPGLDDYRLQPGSVALNAGTNSGVAVDGDGDSRPIGEGFDIGRDEAQQANAIANPALGALLGYTNTQGSVMQLIIPPGAVSGSTRIYYSLLNSPTLPPPPFGLRFSDQPFSFDAFTSLLPGITFLKPVTVTFYYSDTDVAAIDETSLKLYRLEPIFGWQPIGFQLGESQTLDAANNILTARLLSFSRFGKMGLIPGGVVLDHFVFLPVAIK